MTIFAQVMTAMQAQLQAAPAVCAFVELDEDEEPIPQDRTEEVLIAQGGARPLPLGGIAGNPVDWGTTISVHCMAVAKAATALPAAHTLAGKVYARLSATPDLGLGERVYLGEPELRVDTERGELRRARVTLSYTLDLRTQNSTLE